MNCLSGLVEGFFRSLSGGSQNPTCMARLLRHEGISCPPDITRVNQIDPWVRLDLAKRDKIVMLYYHFNPDCSTNHVQLMDYTAKFRREIIFSADDLASACDCEYPANVSILELSFAEFFLEQRWDYLWHWNFYAGNNSQMVKAMEKYHQYLETNYEGGINRFFSPTGSLEQFQRSVELAIDDTRKHVFAPDVDTACKSLEPVVFGGEGVFDLTAEPGTGKTSVLPFRFTSKVVVVALPTPFDAWSAYNMATGKCQLWLKGLELGKSSSAVIYTDSYYAAELVMTNSRYYDVLIVDECDSGKGVTQFLAEVRVKGKVVIRMSASHGRTKSGPSKSFTVSDSEDLPDVRSDLEGFVRCVSDRAAGRVLVLAPDAQAAGEIASLLPRAKLLTAAAGLGNVAKYAIDRAGEAIFVADDVCARGINLDLDMMFDCQLVSEYGTMRHISNAELYQRRNRVGRNRSGWYYSPGLSCVSGQMTIDADVVRHNVLRSIAGLRQKGGGALCVDVNTALALLCSAVEPYSALQTQYMAAAEVETLSSDDVDGGTLEGSVAGRSVRMNARECKPPAWLLQLSDCSPRGSDSGVVTTLGRTQGRGYVARRRSSGDDAARVLSRLSLHRRGLEPDGVVSGSSARSSRDRYSRPAPVSIPVAPPLMDLTELSYDLDWPDLLRQRSESGMSLPTMVPPTGWRHTSSGGVQVDWVDELRGLVRGEFQFDDEEFEVVARAWNCLVSRLWVGGTVGSRRRRDHGGDVELCVRYFQASYALSAAS